MLAVASGKDQSRVELYAIVDRAGVYIDVRAHNKENEVHISNIDSDFYSWMFN